VRNSWNPDAVHKAFPHDSTMAYHQDGMLITEIFKSLLDKRDRQGAFPRTMGTHDKNSRIIFSDQRGIDKDGFEFPNQIKERPEKTVVINPALRNWPSAVDANRDRVLFKQGNSSTITA